ncbi:MAG: hypothetical protein ACKVX7_10510 [Planctomycetota bacterium]
MSAKHLLLIVVIVGVIAGTILKISRRAAANGLFTTDWPVALDEARDSGRPILLYFHSPT